MKKVFRMGKDIYWILGYDFELLIVVISDWFGILVLRFFRWLNFLGNIFK